VVSGDGNSISGSLVCVFVYTVKVAWHQESLFFGGERRDGKSPLSSTEGSSFEWISIVKEYRTTGSKSVVTIELTD
jgi:hypothetical protein